MTRLLLVFLYILFSGQVEQKLLLISDKGQACRETESAQFISLSATKVNKDTLGEIIDC
jgi:hypothetical protein